jgi:hypothetical protein
MEWEEIGGGGEWWHFHTNKFHTINLAKNNSNHNKNDDY